MAVNLGRLGSAASAVAFARLFSLAAAAVQLPILTRMISTSDYALVSLSIAAGLYFSLLSAEPTILPFQRFPGSFDDRRNYSFAFRRLFLSISLLGLSVLVVGFVFGRADVAFGLAGWGFGLALNRFVATAWIMWEKPWPYSWTLVLGTGVRVAVLIASLAEGAQATVAVGLAGILSGIVVLAAMPRALADMTVATDKRAWRPWKVHFGVSLALASLAFTVLLNFTLLILPLAVPTHIVGIYAAMNQVATLTLGAALGVLNTLLYPRIQRIWMTGGREYIHALINFLSVASLLLGFLTLFLVHFFGEVALSFLVGASYTDLLSLELQLAAAVLGNVGQYLSWLHLLNVKSSRIRNVSLLAAIAGSFSSILLIFAFGLTGAGAGLVVGFLLYAILMSLDKAGGQRLRLFIIIYTTVSLCAVFSTDWIFGSVVAAFTIILLYIVVNEYRHLRRVPTAPQLELLP